MQRGWEKLGSNEYEVLGSNPSTTERAGIREELLEEGGLRGKIAQGAGRKQDVRWACLRPSCLQLVIASSAQPGPSGLFSTPDLHSPSWTESLPLKPSRWPFVRRFKFLRTPGKLSQREPQVFLPGLET